MKLILILIVALLSVFASAETARFSFNTNASNKDFVFELTDSNKIQKARDILSGKEKENIHVMGRVIKRSQSYNPYYDFYLDPSSIEFFSFSIEVCDATLPYVQENLDEVCGAFLPGCFYCPWSSKLVKEIK